METAKNERLRNPTKNNRSIRTRLHRLHGRHRRMVSKTNNRRIWRKIPRTNRRHTPLPNRPNRPNLQRNTTTHKKTPRKRILHSMDQTNTKKQNPQPTNTTRKGEIKNEKRLLRPMQKRNKKKLRNNVAILWIQRHMLKKMPTKIPKNKGRRWKKHMPIIKQEQYDPEKRHPRLSLENWRNKQKKRITFLDEGKDMPSQYGPTGIAYLYTIKLKSEPDPHEVWMQPKSAIVIALQSHVPLKGKTFDITKTTGATFKDTRYVAEEIK